MADRVYDNNQGVVAPSYTRKADGAIPFGKLVMKGTAAGDVKVTTGPTVGVMGYAYPNDVIYAKSKTTEYADGDVVTVMDLAVGKEIYLYVDDAGNIAEGAKVEAAANGDIQTAVGHTHTYSASPTDATVANQIIGIALEAANNNTWCKVRVI